MTEHKAIFVNRINLPKKVPFDLDSKFPSLASKFIQRNNTFNNFNFLLKY